MSKPFVLLLSLAAATLLSACDPLAAIRPPLDPATEVCTDLGEDQCELPDPGDVTTKD